jgi:hypothetical protein
VKKSSKVDFHLGKSLVFQLHFQRLKKFDRMMRGRQKRSSKSLKEEWRALEVRNLEEGKYIYIDQNRHLDQS